MGIYRRKGSPYYWAAISTPAGKQRCISTKIPVKAGSIWQERENRQAAEDFYAMEMARLARERVVASSQIERFRRSAPRLPKSPDGWCYLYFARQGAAVKIGRAVDVTRRLAFLQTGQKEPLELLVAVPSHAVVEAAVQKRFAEYRIDGEWFRLEPPLVQFIERLKQHINPIALIWNLADALGME